MMPHLIGCMSAPDRSHVESQYAISPALNSPLAEISQAMPQPADSQSSGVYLLGPGTQAFAARLALIEAAEYTLDVQYYIFHQDDTGRVLLWYLWQAAERGVRVRLLLDGLKTAPGDDHLNVLDTHPNIKVRIYNPFYCRRARIFQLLTDFKRLNHRMHNKSLTADNLATIIGGRNVGDAYFEVNQNINFGDLDVLIFGTVVEQVSCEFDRYWNSQQVYPLALLNPRGVTTQHREQVFAQLQTSLNELSANHYLQTVAGLNMLDQLQNNRLDFIWAAVQLWTDKPGRAALGEQRRDVIDRLLSLFANAEQELFLVSPYFVPREQGAELLTRKARDGVSVTVVTNSLAATDVLAVHAGYQSYRDRMLNNGIKLYEVKASPQMKRRSWSLSSISSLHAKTFVVDRRWVFIGSFNLDPRSAWLNTEMGVLIDSPALAENMLSAIGGLMTNVAYKLERENGRTCWTDLYDERVLYGQPHARWWRRLGAALIGLLPLESQL